MGVGGKVRTVVVRVVCAHMCVFRVGGGEHLAKMVSFVGPTGSPDCPVQCCV